VTAQTQTDMCSAQLPYLAFLLLQLYPPPTKPLYLHPPGSRHTCACTCLQSSPAAANPGLLRQLLILLACPLLDDMEHSGLIALLCATLVSNSRRLGYPICNEPQAPSVLKARTGHP
jgi:hypothetical protein